MSMTIALLILFGGLALYGVLLFFTGYIHMAAPIGAVAINWFWYNATEELGFEMFKYPVFFEKKLLSFLIISVVVFIVVDIISIPRKLRTTSLLTFGSLFVMFGLISTVMRTEGIKPEFKVAYVAFGTAVALILEIAAVIKREYDVVTGISFKIFASIFLAPLPFVITAVICIYNSDGERFSKLNLIVAILISLLVMAAYVGISSLVDHLRRQKLADDSEKAKERNRVRNKIASLMSVQVAKIDEYVSYLQEMSAYIPQAQVSRIYAISREAAQIKNYYSGTANGDALKRITEIKDELFTIKNVVQNLYSSESGRMGASAKSSAQQYDFKSGKLGNSDGRRQDGRSAGASSNGGNSNSGPSNTSSGANSYSGSRNAGGSGTAGYGGQGSAGSGAAGSDRQGSAGSGAAGSDRQGSTGSGAAGSSQELSEQSVIAAFFNGCESESDVKKRYHQLCKVFHPDSDSGDADTFMKIKEEYEHLIEVKRSHAN